MKKIRTSWDSGVQAMHLKPQTGRMRPAAWASLAAALLATTKAFASHGSPETVDKIADILTWVVIVIVPIVGITVFWLVHILPEKIAEDRRHPQAKAIQTLCLIDEGPGPEGPEPRSTSVRWWRRRESNPRPKNHSRQAPHASPLFIAFAPAAPKGRRPPALARTALVVGPRARRRTSRSLSTVTSRADRQARAHRGYVSPCGLGSQSHLLVGR